MATLNSGLYEIKVEFHDLDNCGDILYSYQFLWNGKNVINTEILKEPYRNGFFTTTECFFDDSELLDFFQRILESKHGDSYESLQSPIVYIKCTTWNDTREYSIKNLRENHVGKDDPNRNNEKLFNTYVEIWENQLELNFRLDSDYFESGNSHGVSFNFSTNFDALKEFTDTLKEEYETFKVINFERHIQLDR